MRWREHPLCRSGVAWPERFWGPEAFDAGAWAEIVGGIEVGEECEAIVGALGGVESVVDVGGGTGLITRAVAERVPVIVVEPDARQRAALPGGMRVVEGRAEGVPLADGEIDAAIATWVLQYTDDPMRAVGEMARVARRRVVIVQAAPGNELVEVYNREAAVAGRAPAHHGWLIANAAEALERAGFAVSLHAVATTIGPPPGLDAAAMAGVLARLHFAGHPRIGEMQAATAAYIEERLARDGRLRDDAVMLVARRDG